MGAKKLVELPNTGFAPSNAAVASHLREQADMIENSEHGVRSVVMLIEKTDGTMYRQVCGKPCDMARVTGLLLINAVHGIIGAETDEYC